MTGTIAFAALSGTAVATLGGLGALIIAALYLLRRRRTRVVVPFLHLWTAGPSDHASQRLARRLRRVLSLLLQLSIFALVLLAAADPRPGAPHAEGRTVVVLIDRSASMRAQDEAGSRLARAQALARSIVAGLHTNDRAMVASFAASVTAGTGIEDSRARLLAAIDAVSPSDEPGDLPAALAFTARVLGGRPHPTLILITDGGGHAADDAATDEALRRIDVRVAAVGRRRDNVAIVSFSARRLPADPSSVELALVARSFRAAATDVDLTIVAGPMRLPVARRRLHLPPDARVVATWDDVAVPDARLEAIFEDAHDDLPLDDRAFAVVPQPARLNVLVVGRPNLFLDGVWLGLAVTVHVDRVDPESVERSRARWDDYDAVVFDGVTPDPAPPIGRFLYLDPRGPGSPWSARGDVRDPVITDVAREHPVMKQLGGLADLNITTARRLVLAAGDTAIAAAFNAPLIIARTRPPRLRALAMAFDPRRSDLPLRSAFPLLLANALPWLAERAAAEALSFPTGRTVRVPIGSGARSPARSAEISVTIVAPNATRTSATVDSGGITVFLDQAGFFDIVDDSGRSLARVAANLVSDDESDVTPRASRPVGGHEARPPDAPASAPRRQWWLVALVSALALAGGEWFTYRRRLTV